MLRFVIYAVPLLILHLAMFGFAVELLHFEPRSGAVIKLALFEQPRVPGHLVFGTWLVEAAGLIALFLLAQGRFGAWWLDGLAAGWVAWIFRGPLLVITIVVATGQPQDPWWTLAFGWWVLYSACGLSLAILARRSGLEFQPEETQPDTKPVPVQTIAEEPPAEEPPAEDSPAEEPPAGEPAAEEPEPVEPSPEPSEAESADLPAAPAQRP